MIRISYFYFQEEFEMMNYEIFKEVLKKKIKEYMEYDMFERITYCNVPKTEL